MGEGGRILDARTGRLYCVGWLVYFRMGAKRKRGITTDV